MFHRDRARLMMVGLIALMLGVAAPRSFAQFNFTPGGDIGVQAGYSKDKDADSGNGIYGAHLELLANEWLGIYGAANYRGSESFFPVVSGTRYDMKVRAVPIQLSGRLYIPFTMARLGPFLETGPTWYVQRYVYSPALKSALGISDQTKTRFGWHVGAGLTAPVASKVSAFAEGRYAFLRSKNPLGPSITQNIEKLKYDFAVVDAGLSFHF